MITTRRKFLTGAMSLFAAPAIVSAQNLMPIKVIPFEPYMLLRGPSRYTGELHEVRLYEDANHPASFVGNDFFQRYVKAHSEFAGFPQQVGIAHTREDEKAMRMLDQDSTGGGFYGTQPKLFALSRSEPEPYAIDQPNQSINPSQYINLKHRGLL